MENHVGSLLISIIAIGMAWVFYRADRTSPTSRASSLFLALIGMAVLWAALKDTPPMNAWPTWGNIIARSFDAFATFAGIEWVRRVSQMVANQEGRRWLGGILERFAQALVVVYWVLILCFPNLRSIDFFHLFSNPSDVFHLAFWIHFLPQQLALWLTGLSILITTRKKIDEAEKDRLKYLVMSVPFLITGIWWPEGFYEAYMPIALAIGLVIYFAGSVRYLIVQGQRATFMRRFMPKEVAQMVRKKGLKSAIQPDELEISVVSCDIRGFTKFAAEVSSKEVLGLLHEYYAVVHEAAQKCGGTVKDHAGDGVMTLVGAPVPFDDHRVRAEAMAREVRDKGCALLEAKTAGRLGLGVGVASGLVTTGAVGGAKRLEYVAVGSAVNLASRLCDKAANGEILVDVPAGQNQELSLKLKGYEGVTGANRLV